MLTALSFTLKSGMADTSIDTSFTRPRLRWMSRSSLMGLGGMKRSANSMWPAPPAGPPSSPAPSSDSTASSPASGPAASASAPPIVKALRNSSKETSPSPSTSMNMTML
jgi:hypothetical protein